MIQPVTKYQTPDAIDMIPKDIVMLDFIWYFHLGKDIEDNLLEKGFDVLVGNLYSSHFPRYESRIRKEGIHGGQISAWVATNETSLQQEGKFYDRLGLGVETYTMLGVSLPYMVVPVRPGRNLAGIVEIATMKNRQMTYGDNPAEAFIIYRKFRRFWRGPCQSFPCNGQADGGQNPIPYWG
jgi:hypothetical protein